MSRRLVGAVIVILALEVSYFAYSNRDVVWLSRPRQDLITDAGFGDYARAALARPRISRRVLERIADVAGRRSDFALQLTALDRIANRWPEDASVQLRRADLLRSLGRLSEAEQIYRAQLAAPAAAGKS